jgi:hypothetical protein
MLMLRGLEVLFAPRGVFCIAASRDYRSAADPPEAAMAVVAGRWRSWRCWRRRRRTSAADDLVVLQ